MIKTIDLKEDPWSTKGNLEPCEVDPVWATNHLISAEEALFWWKRGLWSTVDVGPPADLIQDQNPLSYRGPMGDPCSGGPLREWAPSDRTPCGFYNNRRRYYIIEVTLCCELWTTRMDLLTNPIQYDWRPSLGDHRNQGHPGFGNSGTHCPIDANNPGVTSCAYFRNLFWSCGPREWSDNKSDPLIWRFSLGRPQKSLRTCLMREGHGGQYTCIW